MHRHVVNAVAHLSRWIGNVLGIQPAINGLPGVAAVIRSKRARGRDGDENPLGITRIQNDGVQAKPSGAWLPTRS